MYSSRPVKLVKKTLQPPLSGAARLARRWMTEPQSVATTSTLKPSCFSMSTPTSAIAFKVGKSEATMTTIGSPL